MAPDEGKIRAAVALFLEGIGFVTPDVAETPARVTEAMPDLLPGLFRPPPPFEVVQGPETPVVVRDIPFYSLCEHHLLPFFGTADVGYLPADGRIAGVGSIAQHVTWAAGRPGLQERLTEDIAAFLARELRPRALRVRLSARHLCMEMPDPGLRGTILTTEAWRGEETFRPW
jgi:GTP cyclohydrolase I